MPELERALTALAAELEWPETPDLGARVRRRLEEPAPAQRNWVRVAAIALALLAVGIGAAMAVPQARTAILRFFHIEGVTVTRVEKLPPVAPRGPLDLGVPGSLEEVQRRAGFHVVLPHGDRPDAAYFDPEFSGVNLLYGSASRPRAILSEFRTEDFNAVTKIAKAGTDVEYVTVNGLPGIWIGGRHVVRFGNFEPRLAGSTLLWGHGPLTLRLEADVSKENALRIARSVR